MKLFFNILNINEHKPAFEEDKQKYVYIRENRPVGAVVAELKATDGDVDSNLEFMIKNNENMPFEIEGNLLKIKSPLDFEKQNKYKVIVEVTDGNFTAQKEVNIELQNVNDNIPEIIYPTQGQTV